MAKPVAILFLIVIMLSACRMTVHSSIVKADKIEGCSKEYLYIPKKLESSGWYLTPPEYFTKNWKIYYGTFSNKIATSCIIKSDTCTITYYTKKGEIVAKEIHNKAYNSFDCYMKTGQAE